MEKYSVKKPFTVLVGVIMILALGVVSVTRIPTDLLPEFGLPYLMVIAPYPGASPERVEFSLTDPLENALGTITGVNTITSSSNENFALVQMEFEEDTNMDSAMVKVSSALDQLSGSLPEAAGTPVIMEISMDMLATMYVAVNREGDDIYELSDFARTEIIPYMERQEGVASVSPLGLVEQSVLIELNKDKIDDLNDRILEKTNEALADAKSQLDEAQEAVDEAKEKLDEQQGSFGDTLSGALFGQIDGMVINAANNLRIQANSLINQLNDLNYAIAAAEPQQTQSLDDAIYQLEDAENQLTDAQLYLESLQEEADLIARQIADTQAQADAFQEQLAQAQADLSYAIATGDISAQEIAEEAMAQAQANLDAVMAVFYDLLSQQQTNADLQEQAAQALANAQAAYEAAAAAYMAAQGDSGAAYGMSSLEAARQQLESAALAFSSGAGGISDTSFGDLAQTAGLLASYVSQIRMALETLRAADLTGQFSGQILHIENAIAQLNSGLNNIPSLLYGLQSGYAGLTQAQLEASVGFSTATTALASAQSQLEAAQQQYEDTRETVLKNANADSLLTAATLGQLIYAENFSMPAGYIDDKDDNSWLLRIGDEYETPEEFGDILLMDNDEIGTIRIADVADITMIDNSGDSYGNLNGSNGVMLSIYKNSTAATNEVSKACREAISELEERFEGTHMVIMMDQGVYITMIIQDILSSILLGAILAIIVLALFLQAVRPTMVVAISIPLSVLFALVMMYFTDLSLNIMTLAGLSLGIGMLVDNSIVVMENIFRLRGRGIPAPRAAVQGARQVRGAIIASTLTTICVFLPVVFASGSVRKLLVPLALTIAYCLTASLIIALTVVPAASSTLMKHTEAKELRFFVRMQESYGKTLRWCLRHKFVTLLLAIALLGVSAWQLLRMGIVFLPEMTSNYIEVDIVTPEGLTREESYAMADEAVDAILQVDGVLDFGVMDQERMAGLVSAFAGGSGAYGTYFGYVTADEESTPEEIHRICDDIVDSTAHLDCTVKAGSSGMDDISGFTSSGGLSINVYGADLDKIREITADLKDMIEDTEGFTDVLDGTEDGSPTLQLHIDRDKLMTYGLTTAQLYQQIAARVDTSVTSTTITVNDLEMDVTIVDPTDPLTKENLLDMEFATEAMDVTSAMTGQDASSGGASMSTAAFDTSMLSMLTGEDEEGAEEAAEVEKNEEKEEEKDEIPETFLLRDVATLEETTSLQAINRENMSHFLTVTAQLEPGYNISLLSRELEPKVEAYQQTLPKGYSIVFGGETDQIADMLGQMIRMMLLGLLFIYLIMVAQFQSLLSPFIVLFTIPLAFTGGIFGLLIAREQLTLLALMGFLILMGTVVNNGIVFVDFANQLRIGGMERRDALVATGKSRMRPILMTALTTILAMTQLMFGSGMGSQIGRGMAIVITGGLLYATLMTLYIVPVIYDILFRRAPLSVDVGDDLDDVPDDAAEFLEQMNKEKSQDEA